MKDTELKRQRDEALYRVYKQGLRTQHFMSMHEAADWCRMQPAPKYYLSSKNLVNYIKMLQCGYQLNSLHASTRRKVKHLFRMYIEYRKTHPESATMSKDSICEILVDEPAPEFYIGHDLAILILQRMRREWRKQ